MINATKDYLNGLMWDGKRRIDFWESGYLGAERNFIVGPKFLIQMVARGLDPGCRAESMLILEGRPGSGKSRVCETLAGTPQWFLREAAHDLSIGAIKGRWLVEITEIVTLSDHLLPLVKAFTEQSVDLYRDENQEVQYRRRQCVFVGTTNVPAPGNFAASRRFWVVKTGVILLDELARDRDQLFAEAVQRYREGARWWIE